MPKNITIAIVLIAAGIGGTATYYEAAELPLIENQIRYEKVDNGVYDKYTINVSRERIKVSEIPALVGMLNAKAEEFKGNPDEQKRYEFALMFKAQKEAELEQAKAIGVTEAESVLAEMKTK